jgi:hypothetical protein
MVRLPGSPSLSRRQGCHLLSKIIFLSGHSDNLRGNETVLADSCTGFSASTPKIRTGSISAKAIDCLHPKIPEGNNQAGVISAVPARACEGK